MNNQRITKQLVKKLSILAMALFGLLSVPVANADVVVRYSSGVGHYDNSYHEPMRYRHNNRAYSNTSSLGNITYTTNRSYRRQYRDRCEDRYYSEPRQYRNNYYYGFQNHYQNPRSYRDNYNRHDRRPHYRDDRRRNYGYHRDAPHGNQKPYRSSGYRNNHSSISSGGRVHITIK